MSRPAKAYVPAAYDAEASSSAATTEATPTRAPARTPARTPESARAPARTPEPAPEPAPSLEAVDTPAARPDAPPDAQAESPAPRAFSPVVFQPRGVPSPDEDDRADDHAEHHPARETDPDPSTTASAPWFCSDDSADDSAAAAYPVARVGRPVDPVESDRMARTVVGVGERARRMAEATALAQRDMARRLAETGAPRVGRGDGTVSRGYDVLVALQAERGARAEKTREVDALRRRERALATKNKELEASLSANAAYTRDQERAVREAKAAADAARAELQAALVRARLGGRAAPMLTSRAAAVAGVRGVRASQPITAHERVAPAADAPKTLREAAARFLASEVGEGAAEDHLAASLRDAGMRPARRPRGESRSSRDAEERRRRREERGHAFLERMQARQEEAARRRAEREWMRRATVAAAGGGRKGWDNSRDVVVRVGEDPPPTPLAETRSTVNATRAAERNPRRGEGKGGKRARASKKRSPRSEAARAAAERQRANDERRSRGLEPIFDSSSPRAAKKPAKRPKSVSPRTEPTDAEMRATASRMLSTSEGRASLRASGFDLGPPGAQPSTGLFAMSPGRRVGAAGGDPRKEIAAMRTILDEVVAHLRALHMAANAGGDRGAAFPAAETISRGRFPGDLAGGPSSSGPSSSGPSSVASSVARRSGPFVLDSVQHAKALEMLREVEAREAATRARWGLFSPAHPPPDASWRHGDVVARASADIAAIEAETRGASARASLEARSLRLAGVAALESLVDEDTVARVWEARSQYVRWQDAAGDGVVSEGGPEGDFSPVEVNEEVAERLLDGLLTDVAHELGGACDDAAEIVVEREFGPTSTGDAGTDANVGEGGEGRPGRDVGSNLLDDDVVGPAVERAYVSKSRGANLKSAGASLSRSA